MTLVVWDRVSAPRVARREAFKLFAAVGRRTTDRVAGALATARIVVSEGRVAVDCDVHAEPILMATRFAIAEAIFEVFGRSVDIKIRVGLIATVSSRSRALVG